MKNTFKHLHQKGWLVCTAGILLAFAVTASVWNGSNLRYVLGGLNSLLDGFGKTLDLQEYKPFISFTFFLSISLLMYCLIDLVETRRMKK
jgi:hypothetical protein